ncbi:MAG TPA: glycosyltransferase family 39 protein [Candidatus Binatia bacterium]|nr:glycosyltransferase family 39 protein [Candidatus Binatia bacterium]
MSGKGGRRDWAESVVGSPITISDPIARPSTLAGSASRWLRWEVPAAILAFATAVRLLGLDKSLWLDEASSYLQATAPDFVAAARAYDHPPLYYALLRTGLHATRSFPILRLFSVGCGVGAVAVFCFFFGARQRVAGWYAGLLLAASPAFVLNSQELRQYALLSLEFALALWFAWRLVQDSRNTRALIGLASVLALAACTHLVTSFFVAALGCVTLWQQRREPLDRLGRVALCFVPAALLLWFFKSRFLTQTVMDPALWWMPPVDAELLRYVFNEITGWTSIMWVADASDGLLPGMATGVLAVSTLAAALVVWTAWGHRSASSAHALLAMALLYCGLVITYALAVVPIVWPRIMLPGMLPFMLGLGLGVATNPRARQRAAAGAAAVLLAMTMMVPWVSGLAWEPLEPLRAVSDALRRNSKPADLLVLIDGADWALEPYWPEYKERRRVLKVGLAEPVEQTLAALRAARARRPPGSAFVLLYRSDLFSEPRQDVLDEIMSSISSGGMPVEKRWEKSAYHIVRFRGP